MKEEVGYSTFTNIRLTALQTLFTEKMRIYIHILKEKGGFSMRINTVRYFLPKLVWGRYLIAVGIGEAKECGRIHAAWLCCVSKFVVRELTGLTIKLIL